MNTDTATAENRTDLERAALTAIDDVADLTIKISRIVSSLHSLGARTEGQYEQLAARLDKTAKAIVDIGVAAEDRCNELEKRLDKAAEEVMKLKTRLKKLEGKDV